MDQDYVSEKFFYGFLGNTVMVYYGSKVARVFQPWNASYIDIGEFETLQELAEYVLDVGHNYDKWVQFFERRNQSIPEYQRGLDLWSIQHPQGLCRVCDCFCNETCSSSYSAGEGLHWPII